MCDVLLEGVPGCVKKCDMGKGGQNWPKIACRTLWTTPSLIQLQELSKMSKMSKMYASRLFSFLLASLL